MYVIPLRYINALLLIAELIFSIDLFELKYLMNGQFHEEYAVLKAF